MIIYFHICRISRTLLSPISGVFLHYNIFHKESCSFSATYVKARKNFSLAFYYSSSASTIKFGSNSSNSSSAIWKSSSDSTQPSGFTLTQIFVSPTTSVTNSRSTVTTILLPFGDTSASKQFGG